MEELILDQDSCNIIIKLWNERIHEYGNVTMYDYKVLYAELTGEDVNVTFTDHCYGWTKEIATRNFRKIRGLKSKYSFKRMYRFILPKAKHLLD